MVVFLIGFMGSGKSFLSKKLASLYNFSVFDLDHEIEVKEGKTINQIFDTFGEDYFRNIEALVLRELTDSLTVTESDLIKTKQSQTDFIVIACGGGTPCFSGNMEWMNERGLTIWINPKEDILVERLEGEKSQRPLVKGLSHEEIKSFVNQKLVARAPFYEQSKITIEDSTLSTENFLKLIEHAQDFI